MPTTPNIGIPTPADSVKISELASSQRAGFNKVDEVLAGGLTTEMTEAAQQIAETEAVLAVANVMENSSIVTAEPISSDKFEFASEDGIIFLSVDDIHGSPYFTGSPTTLATPIERDSMEWTDEAGAVLLAIDNLSSVPRFRGAEPETHFIISAGQSNAMGIGTPTPVGTNQPLFNLRTIPQRGAAAGREVAAVDPLSHPWNNPTPGSIGHAVTVARKYALDNPDVRVVILPMAASGTGFFLDSTGYTWAPSREGAPGLINLYRETITRSNVAIAQYTGVSRVAAILWHQGEADAVAGTTQAAYEAELDALIAGFRAEIVGAAQAPVIVGQLGWEFRNVRAPGTWSQINAAHQTTPTRVNGTAFAAAPSQGFMNPDNTHFTGQGQKLMAHSMWAAFEAAYYNL